MVLAPLVVKVKSCKVNGFLLKVVYDVVSKIISWIMCQKQVLQIKYLKKYYLGKLPCVFWGRLGARVQFNGDVFLYLGHYCHLVGKD